MLLGWGLFRWLGLSNRSLGCIGRLEVGVGGCLLCRMFLRGVGRYCVFGCGRCYG